MPPSAFLRVQWRFIKPLIGCFKSFDLDHTFHSSSGLNNIIHRTWHRTLFCCVKCKVSGCLFPDTVFHSAMDVLLGHCSIQHASGKIRCFTLSLWNKPTGRYYRGVSLVPASPCSRDNNPSSMDIDLYWQYGCSHNAVFWTLLF